MVHCLSGGSLEGRSLKQAHGRWPDSDGISRCSGWGRAALMLPSLVWRRQERL